MQQSWKMMKDAAYSLTMIEQQFYKPFVAQLSLRSTVLDHVVEAQRDDKRYKN